MQEQYIDIRNGTKRYFKDKEMTILHRLDGPAVQYASGYKEWNVNGKIHRTDGPAIEYPSDGGKAWYINGVFIFSITKDGTLWTRMH